VPPEDVEGEQSPAWVSGILSRNVKRYPACIEGYRVQSQVVIALSTTSPYPKRCMSLMFLPFELRKLLKFDPEF
jgi:hypothetical protein